MTNWRTIVEPLTDYLESDDCDPEIAVLGDLIYFIGESESDGVIAFLERRDASAIYRLILAARLIESDELYAVCGKITEALEQLPFAGSHEERIARAIEDPNNVDPFSKSEQLLFDSLPAIEEQLADAITRYGVTDALQT